LSASSGTVIVRPETREDGPAVRAINLLAFGQPTEADLVDRLRAACPEAVSLVAEVDGLVAGHILFTPVTVEDGRGPIVGMGLAPMAVLPERQRTGVGAALIREGLDRLRRQGCPFVVVVGHPEYYPRFGFQRASRHGLTSQWEGVSDAAFLALVLDATAMAGAAGVARYRDEFDEL
jgi:putative acetyltransferase